MLEKLIDKYPEKNESVVWLYMEAASQAEKLFNYIDKAIIEYDKDKTAVVTGKIEEIHKAWKEFDSEHVIPEKPKRSGCYIATCVYGSYDCSQVWTLRRYRDYRLAQSWHGRLFIKTYYAISPTIVRLFGKKTWFHKLWRGYLDKRILDLKKKGYEDTPYYD